MFFMDQNFQINNSIVLRIFSGFLKDIWKTQKSLSEQLKRILCFKMHYKQYLYCL